MSIVPLANSEPLIENDETMRYRPFGKTGLRISALSFGCMRLSDNQDLNTPLISRAVDVGVNYFETTRGYCGGQCQHRTAPGLKDKTTGVIVSGKAPLSPESTAFTFRQEIERQLDILGLSHFKFFQVGWFAWEKIQHLLKPGGALDAIRQAKKEGLIQYLGFTGHDKPENFIKCIETGLFDSITVPYNLIHRMYEPTIKRAGELGIGVVAMCPVAGGALAFESRRIRDALKMDLPTTEMALRFVLSNPDVSTACSGMSTMEQLEQNVKTINNFDPEKDGNFNEFCEGVERLRETFGEKTCTTCGYCIPCPQDVNIPYMMQVYQNWQSFGLGETSEQFTGEWPKSALAGMNKENHPKNCTECGACEEKCPNNIPITQTLKTLRDL